MTVEQILTELTGKMNLTLVILTMALLLARILPMIILSPFMGGDLVTTEVKLGFGILLSMVIYPAVAERVVNIPVSPLPYVMLLLKELFLGICFSFVIGSIFDTIQMAGSLVDMLAGTSMAQVFVPQIQAQTTLFSSLKLQLAIVMFLTLDGHHVVIEALADSVVMIPLDRFPEMSHGSWAFYEFLLRLFGDMLRIALMIAAPAFLATFLTDLALGMINRVAPQVQVFFISMSLKPMVASLLVLVSLNVILRKIGVEFASMLQALKEAMRLLT